MSIYICTICNNQKDSDFNCAELDGKECCEECFEEQLTEKLMIKENRQEEIMQQHAKSGKFGKQTLQEIQEENRRLILEAVQLPKSLLCPPQDLAKETAEMLKYRNNTSTNF